MRKALIDADILLYEVGSCGTYVDELTEEVVTKPFNSMKELMDQKIAEIIRRSGSNCYTLFLSGPNNFRNEIAKKKAYKDNRKDKPKPFHYDNLKAYLIATYGALVSDGIEADDEICIAQTAALAAGEETVICSRDKDLRQCQGLHYSWECGVQAEKETYLVSGFGTLTPHYNKAGEIDRLNGTGDKWFLAQLLMGDATDNIPGLKGWGPVKVYSLLSPYSNYNSALGKVIDCYIENVILRFPEIYDEDLYQLWTEEITEQAKLVYMIRERNEDGSPKHWRM